MPSDRYLNSRTVPEFPNRDRQIRGYPGEGNKVVCKSDRFPILMYGTTGKLLDENRMELTVSRETIIIHLADFAMKPYPSGQWNANNWMKWDQ